MRTPKVLESMVVGGIKLSNGTMPCSILAIDVEEVAWYTARMKGRKGVKLISIVKGKPGDELPMDHAWRSE